MWSMNQQHLHPLRSLLETCTVLTTPEPKTWGHRPRDLVKLFRRGSRSWGWSPLYWRVLSRDARGCGCRADIRGSATGDILLERKGWWSIPKLQIHGNLWIILKLNFIRWSQNNRSGAMLSFQVKHAALPVQSVCTTSASSFHPLKYYFGLLI